MIDATLLSGTNCVILSDMYSSILSGLIIHHRLAGKYEFLSAAATTAADDDDWGNSDWGLPTATTAASAAAAVASAPAAAAASAGQSHGQTEYAQHQASHANTNQVKGLLLSLSIYLCFLPWFSCR